jgi:hypothetical protein
MTIDMYCDLAIERNCLKSDRELSKALGFSGSDVSNYRRKRVWPSDITMIILAELAGLPAEIALIKLKIWQNSEACVREVYQRILTRLQNLEN